MERSNDKQLKADIALLLVTIGWGASFLLTRYALDDLEVYNFLGLRFLLAGLISGVIFYKDMLKADFKTWILGAGVGIVLFSSYAFQTVGLTLTSVSNSAFITGINVVLVPFMSAILMRKNPDRASVAGVLLAFIGLCLMTMKGFDLHFNLGDFYTLICAIMYALYIILVGKYTVQVNSVAFAVVQILTVGALSMGVSVIMETPTLPSSGVVWGYILFLSVICTSAAFIVQSVAQNYTTATHTALIYSAEPVFAAMFAAIITAEYLNMQGMIGAALIMGGMLVAELLPLLMSKKGEQHG